MLINCHRMGQLIFKASSLHLYLLIWKPFDNFPVIQDSPAYPLWVISIKINRETKQGNESKTHTSFFSIASSSHIVQTTLTYNLACPWNDKQSQSQLSSHLKVTNFRHFPLSCYSLMVLHKSFCSCCKLSLLTVPKEPVS